MNSGPDLSVGSEADITHENQFERPEVVRKLASVQEISAIDPIDGADNIECATILAGS